MSAVPVTLLSGRVQSRAPAHLSRSPAAGLFGRHGYPHVHKSLPMTAMSFIPRQSEVIALTGTKVRRCGTNAHEGIARTHAQDAKLHATPRPNTYIIPRKCTL